MTKLCLPSGISQQLLIHWQRTVGNQAIMRQFSVPDEPVIGPAPVRSSEIANWRAYFLQLLAALLRFLMCLVHFPIRALGRRSSSEESIVAEFPSGRGER